MVAASLSPPSHHAGLRLQTPSKFQQQLSGETNAAIMEQVRVRVRVRAGVRAGVRVRAHLLHVRRISLG